MGVRKTVTLVEEINSEYGARANPALRRVAIAAVFKNTLIGKAPDRPCATASVNRWQLDYGPVIG